MSKKIATIISRIFDPFVSLGAVFMVLYFGSPQFFPALLLMIGLPLALYIFAWETKIISNWDVSDRKERPKLLWTMFGIEVIAGLIFRTPAIVPVLVTFAGFAVVTHFWKISGHAMAIAFATGMIVERFGVGWWPVFLIVPVVGWARVVRRDHTIWQVTAGALYSWSLLILFSKIFNS